MRHWGLFHNRFAWSWLVEDSGHVPNTAAKTPCTKPDQMFRNILRYLIEKLRVEVLVFIERHLCAGEDAETGQRLALVNNGLVRARVRMD